MISIFVVKSSIHWLVGADRGRRTAHGRGGELTAMYRALERSAGSAAATPRDPLGFTIHHPHDHGSWGRWMTRRKGARNRDLYFEE